MERKHDIDLEKRNSINKSYEVASAFCLMNKLNIICFATAETILECSFNT